MYVLILTQQLKICSCAICLFVGVLPQ